MIKAGWLIPPTVTERPIQYELNARVCLLLASCMLFVTLIRPLIAELPPLFLIAGYVDSALMLVLWRLLLRPFWQPYGALLIIGLCFAMLAPLLLFSGGANSHYSPIIPLFPLFAVLLGNVGLAVVCTLVWSLIWIVFYIFGVSELDQTVSYWHAGKTVSRTIWLILSGVMVLVITVSFENRQRRLQQSLVALTLTDPLTQVGNRRAMEQMLAEQIQLSKRTKAPFTLMMIDVDHFKQFNDLRGHDVGDKALQQVAACLSRLARAGQDSVTRFGGEEFVVILRNTSAHQAILAADKYRQGVRDLQLRYRPEVEDEVLTITIGLADSYLARESESLIKFADKALYHGKQAGRDCTFDAATLV